MAEENLRRIIGVVRQQTSAAKPEDPEMQALLAILRGSGSDAEDGAPEPQDAATEPV
jgi:hypothetical protein